MFCVGNPVLGKLWEYCPIVHSFQRNEPLCVILDLFSCPKCLHATVKMKGVQGGWEKRHWTVSQ